MKVLYIGYYRDGTGWANAAQGYIMALDAAGITVVPRCIELNGRSVSIPKRIEELENLDASDCDCVIQHVLPHHMDFNGNFEKNIALYVTETDHCRNTSWPERINLMDESWVPNSFMANECAEKSGILNDHYIVPHAFDMQKYQKEYKKITIPELQNKFVFYYVGEMNRRKNIGAILKAFHLEFEINEDVGLLLKTHIPGATATESERAIQALSAKVKEGLKLYPDVNSYHQELFICDYLDDEDIMRIHATFDCFVSGTLGEAWGIPIFDAMAMGKTPICTNTGGPRDFLGDGGYLVDSRQEPCFGMVEGFPDLYVGNEHWDTPDINQIRMAMRSAYENKNGRLRRSRRGIENSYRYSYQEVGSIMRSVLEGNETNDVDTPKQTASDISNTRKQSYQIA